MSKKNSSKFSDWKKRNKGKGVPLATRVEQEEQRLYPNRPKVIPNLYPNVPGNSIYPNMNPTPSYPQSGHFSEIPSYPKPERGVVYPQVGNAPSRQPQMQIRSVPTYNNPPTSRSIYQPPIQTNFQQYKPIPIPQQRQAVPLPIQPQRQPTVNIFALISGQKQKMNILQSQIQEQMKVLNLQDHQQNRRVIGWEMQIFERNKKRNVLIQTLERVKQRMNHLQLREQQWTIYYQQQRNLLTQQQLSRPAHSIGPSISQRYPQLSNQQIKISRPRPPTSGKMIVVFVDGTRCNNFPENLNRTNIWKLYRFMKPSLVSGKNIVKIYQLGIGAEELKEKKEDKRNALFKLLDYKDCFLKMAAGWKMSDEVFKCYHSIIQAYDEGDEICFFGFSRGSHTVRCCANLISRYGILKREAIPTTKKGKKKNERKWIIEQLSKGFLKKKFSSSQFHEGSKRVRYLGIFDTVAATIDQDLDDLRIYDKNMTTNEVRNIGKIFHLMSLEEGRSDIKIAGLLSKRLNDLDFDLSRIEFNEVIPDQVTEIWCAGYHSDLGGGLKTDSNNSEKLPRGELSRNLEIGLSLVHFLTMMVSSASKIGFTFFHDAMLEHFNSICGSWHRFSEVPSAGQLIRISYEKNVQERFLRSHQETWPEMFGLKEESWAEEILEKLVAPSCFTLNRSPRKNDLLHSHLNELVRGNFVLSDTVSFRLFYTEGHFSLESRKLIEDMVRWFGGQRSIPEIFWEGCQPNGKFQIIRIKEGKVKELRRRMDQFLEAQKLKIGNPGLRNPKDVYLMQYLMELNPLLRNAYQNYSTSSKNDKSRQEEIEKDDDLLYGTLSQDDLNDVFSGLNL